MKKKLFGLLGLSILGLSLIACQHTGTGDDSAASGGGDTLQTEAAAEIAPHELSSDELEEYTEYLNGCYGFVMSEYDDVRNVNLYQIFRNGGGAGEAPGEAGENAYMEAAGTSEIFTDLIYMPAANIDRVLLEKTGYSLQDMKDAGNELTLTYSESLDAYFSEVGDTNYVPFRCSTGSENEDGTLTLNCDVLPDFAGEYSPIRSFTVTLDKASLHFISNVITDGYREGEFWQE